MRVRADRCWPGTLLSEELRKSWIGITNCNVILTARRRGRNGLDSVGVRPHRETRPSIHKTQRLAYDGESITRVSPPVIGIEWIFVSGVGD